MGRRNSWRVCSQPGCPEFAEGGGRCPGCKAEAERKRGTARQRGYRGLHETRFRPGVLAKDPVCVLCKAAPSVHADHWPLSRKELQAQGLDPDDPRHGRGLCGPCHSTETATAQPGGWNA